MSYLKNPYYQHVKGKGKDSMHNMKVHRGSRGVVPFILTLSTRHRKAVSFMAKLLYPQGRKNPPTHQIKGWVHLQGNLDVLERRKIDFLCHESSSPQQRHYTN